MDGASNEPFPQDFDADAHARFIESYLDKEEDTMLAFMTAHLRTGGAYWGFTCLDLLHKLDEAPTGSGDASESASSSGNLGRASASTKKEHLDADKICAWALSCQNADGGFGFNASQDSHITASHYAVLVLCDFGRLSLLDEKFPAAVLKGGDEGNNAESSTITRKEALLRWIAARQCKSQTPSSQGADSTSCSNPNPAGDIINTRVGGVTDACECCEVEDESPTRLQSGGASSSSSGPLKDSTGVAESAGWPTLRVQQRLIFRQDEGSFTADVWGETDPRLVYNAFACCAILGALDRIDVAAGCTYLSRCYNADGGFGSKPGSESHAAYTWVCVAALAVVDSICLIDVDRTGWFLCSRQTVHGGLNGRPEKAPDVCYSWWILAALGILNRMHWIDARKLGSWILQCQDVAAREQLPCGAEDAKDDHAVAEVAVEEEMKTVVEKHHKASSLTKGEDSSTANEKSDCPATAEATAAARTPETTQSGGGIADRPGNEPDPFHTFFGTAALSLIVHEMPELRSQLVGNVPVKKIDPVFALAEETVQGLGLAY
ncbi:unnamed protein product [Amoebophrya sp. A25]|nr:unnamed protein product [Amoebophrya sp. A25]|eukprot:GSA25T00000807001.1